VFNSPVVRRLLLVLCVSSVLPCGSSASQDNLVRDKYPSGKTRTEYRVDKEGKKHGSYVEFFESGKKKVTATFVHGDPDGQWDEYRDDGHSWLRKKYKTGTIEELIRLDDKGPSYQVLFKRDGIEIGPPGSKTNDPAFPLSQNMIRTRIPEIEGTPMDVSGENAKLKYEEPYSLTAPHKPGKLKREYLEDALRHLKAYRWLCGLTTDQELDDGCIDFCQHGAVIMGAIKELTHFPEQPADMDKAFFDKAYKGTSSSNIASGSDSLRQAIDMFMDDSDSTNIDRVGHRMWCLNPRKKKAGFGEVEMWICEWSVDSSAEIPRPDFVRYPAAGYFPVEYFHSHAAWCCSVNADKYTLPKDEKQIKVKLWTLDDEYMIKDEIPLDYFHKNGNNLIFRPKAAAEGNQPRRPGPRVGYDWAGKRVLVYITGAKQQKVDAPIFYVVEFFKLKKDEKKPEEPPPAEPTEDRPK